MNQQKTSTLLPALLFPVRPLHRAPPCPCSQPAQASSDSSPKIRTARFLPWQNLCPVQFFKAAAILSYYFSQLIDSGIAKSVIASSNSNSFAPTEIRRVTKALPTSACTVVVETNCGTAYLKALGNDEGPWTLACELIGTRLANWLGLSTFEFAQMVVESYHNIQFHNGRDATPGPAFLTRAVRGEQWDGTTVQLKRLSNPHDIGRLVLFDTWTLNCDRFSRKNEEIGTKPRRNLGNVFLEEDPQGGGFVLKAMDHTHCFSCGNQVSPQILNINTIKDPRVFGLFPEFRSLIFEGS